MDYFSRCVDSSLWASRTFEDPEYDADESAAAASRTPFVPPKDLPANLPHTLIVACGADAIRAVRASVTVDEELNFAGDDIQVPLAILDDVGILFVDVVDSRSVELASCVLSSLSPKSTMLLTSAARWALRGRPEPGVMWVNTAAASPASGQLMASPTFLDGAAAAFISEATMTQRALVAATLVKDGMHACYHDIEVLRSTFVSFLDKAPKWITADDDFEAAVRRLMKDERAQSSAMYM